VRSAGQARSLFVNRKLPSQPSAAPRSYAHLLLIFEAAAAAAPQRRVSTGSASPRASAQHASPAPSQPAPLSPLRPRESPSKRQAELAQQVPPFEQASHPHPHAAPQPLRPGWAYVTPADALLESRAGAPGSSPPGGSRLQTGRPPPLVAVHPAGASLSASSPAATPRSPTPQSKRALFGAVAEAVAAERDGLQGAAEGSESPGGAHLRLGGAGFAGLVRQESGGAEERGMLLSPSLRRGEGAAASPLAQAPLLPRRPQG